jgi:hypothetical protein
LPVNASEARLFETAQRSFLKLWSYANPYRATGKEIADLLVIFGNDVIVFSDKQSTFRDDGYGWQRWYRRTVTASIKQLSGAYRVLAIDNQTIYVDERASQALPFKLPAPDQCRIHLLAVARVDLKSRSLHPSPGLRFDGSVAGSGKPFCVGPLKVGERVVHIFDAETLETLLSELDTISDFVWYLNRRERIISDNPDIQFRELDFLMLSLLERGEGQWGLLLLPDSANAGIPEGLWTDAYCTECRNRSQLKNRPSYVVDRLIEHFHDEYIHNRLLSEKNIEYHVHEQALRHLASERRFSRRIISGELFGILDETDQSTFWAATTESIDVPGVRYVWLAYPPPPDGVSDEEVSRVILNHLKDHIYVARASFAADLIIGISVPNHSVQIGSHFLIVFDGTHWTEDAQKGAEELRTKQGIFANVEAITRSHIR